MINCAVMCSDPSLIFHEAKQLTILVEEICRNSEGTSRKGGDGASLMANWRIKVNSSDSEQFMQIISAFSPGLIRGY